MPTLSARLVLRPTSDYRCDDCGRLLGPHIYMYGMGDFGDKPGPIRYCMRCAVTIRSEEVVGLVTKFRCAVEQASADVKEWQRIVEALGPVEQEGSRLEGWEQQVIDNI